MESEKQKPVFIRVYLWLNSIAMDPVTHGLTGALIAETGFAQRLGLRSRFVIVGAAMFPDIDIVYRIGGLPEYIANHRALTHSFLGIAAAGALLGAIFGKIDEERRYVPWMSACWVALLSHLILDLITSYGTVVLYPFSKTRFYFDWVFILDAFLTGILLICLIFARLNRAKGERRAKIGLTLAAVYIAFCAGNHALALTRLKQSAEQHQISFQEAAAIPQPLLPVLWSGVLDSGTHYYRTSFLSFGMPQPPFDIFTKTTGSFYEQRARESDLGALYYWFARYPVVNERTEAKMHIIEFSDLRFYIRVHHFPVRKPFVLRIKMDDAGNILETRFARS
jgi:inner membrane protein